MDIFIDGDELVDPWSIISLSLPPEVNGTLELHLRDGMQELLDLSEGSPLPRLQVRPSRHLAGGSRCATRLMATRSETPTYSRTMVRSLSS